jgi:UDP-glucose 4-epimerase
MLVIGGSGFLGSEIVRAARRDGRPVSALTRRRPDTTGRPWLDEVDWFVGSAADEDALCRALDGVGWVVDAVGCPPPPVSDLSRSSLLVQAVPTLSLLLDVLRRTSGVGVTFLSSGGTVYGDSGERPVSEDRACAPVSAYGMTKLLAEACLGEHADRHGIPVRILRVSNAYGPTQSCDDGQGLIAACIDAALGGGAVTIFGDGGNVRDYVEAADVARAVVELPPTLDGYRTVNVGSGTGHRVDEVLDILGDVTGVRFTVTHSPARRQDVRSIVLDTTVLASLLPWVPRSLGDGVRDSWLYRAGLSPAAGRSA